MVEESASEREWNGGESAQLVSRRLKEAGVGLTDMAQQEGMHRYVPFA
jgi:hypothetical protein